MTAAGSEARVNVFTFDPSPLMKLNGSTRDGVTYLAANIVRAERGFHIDPASFLCIPLRIMIAETEDGTGQISFDLPADLMAVFGHPDLDDVGADANRTLAGLLKHLGVPVPPELHGFSDRFDSGKEPPAVRSKIYSSRTDRGFSSRASLAAQGDDGPGRWPITSIR